LLVHTQIALSSQVLAIHYSGDLPRRIEETRTLTEGTGWVNSVSITDDGQQVALSRGRGGESSLEVVPFEGGAARVVAGTPAEELGPSWSPDGKRLAFVRSDSGGSRLMVVNYPGGTAQRLGSATLVLSLLTKTADQGLLPFLGFVSASWSNDGRWLSYPAGDLRRIGLINLERQAESFVHIPDSLGNGYVGGGLVSPNGRQLVISTLHKWNDWGELRLADADGRSWRRLREPFGESYPMRWTEEGWLYVLNNRAYFSDGGQPRMQLWRLPMAGGKPEFVAPVPEGCASFSLSRDGRRAACDYNTRQSDLFVATGFDSDGR
jgi:hypothetical protein